ncbi:MAG: hypothetical protein HYU88_10515 [Chloroflexi bacterium]|nr:hypothetical protein [Chloroflexota bacterium]
MAVRVSAQQRTGVVDVAVRSGLGAGFLAFALVGGVALVAGVSPETAVIRALVGAAVLGGLAGIGAYVLGSGRAAATPAAAAAPPRRRGRLVDVALPEEDGL